MSKPSKAAQGSAAAAGTQVKFRDMGFIQKLTFIGKGCAFFITLGFAYPNIFLD